MRRDLESFATICVSDNGFGFLFLQRNWGALTLCFRFDAQEIRDTSTGHFADVIWQRCTCVAFQRSASRSANSQAACGTATACAVRSCTANCEGTGQAAIQATTWQGFTGACAMRWMLIEAGRFVRTRVSLIRLYIGRLRIAMLFFFGLFACTPWEFQTFAQSACAMVVAHCSHAIS